MPGRENETRISLGSGEGWVTSGIARVALVIGCWTSVSTTVTPPRYPS